MTRALILGGTAEASALAEAVAGAGIDAVLSYAGRVSSPRAQPVPVRTGGFGGAEGLAEYLRAKRITHLIDATHPFAAEMSRNAIAASDRAAVPLIALERPAWMPQAGDNWQCVPDIAGAVAVLDGPAERVFLALGRVNLEAFAARPQHRYLLRLVDAPDAVPLPDAEVIVARGPFRYSDDLSLLRTHRIMRVVAKNAGGTGARAKIDAARELGLPVVMIDRPDLPARATAGTVAEVMAWLGHDALRGV